jgi:allantoinase
VETRDLHFRHKLSPYLGRTLLGRVHLSVLRGELVHRGGASYGTPRGKPLLGRDRDAPGAV